MPIRIGHVVAASAFLACTAGIARASEIAWAPSYDRAVASAKQSHKLIMVDFYTDW